MEKDFPYRSEEHTSELQSHLNLVCRLLLEKNFFFNDTATTEIYTLSLHDALPIFSKKRWQTPILSSRYSELSSDCLYSRSEEHTSELQSPLNLVCRLLLEKIMNIITLALYSDNISTLNCYITFFQAEDGIRDSSVTGVQTCALPI